MQIKNFVFLAILQLTTTEGKVSDASNVKEALDALLSNAVEMYGDAFESFWMYEGETCPCCRKRKVEGYRSGEELLLALSSYIYRDCKVLIGYLLCGQCISELMIPGARQKTMYKNIEEKLKEAYLESLKSSAS